MYASYKIKFARNWRKETDLCLICIFFSQVEIDKIIIKTNSYQKKYNEKN